MVDRQQDLGKVPERSPEEVGAIAYRLVLAYSARQDFTAALAIVNEVGDPLERDKAQVKIARAQVQSGLEPIFPPDHFLERAGRWMEEDVPLLQAEMGDIEGALQTVALGYEYKVQIWPASL